MGEGGGPAPHRVQDLALNLTWFRVRVTLRQAQGGHGELVEPFPLPFTLLDKFICFVLPLSQTFYLTG